MKTTVFISHATHEDDFFAAWLASKLRVLGYDSWVDLEDLRAGSSFFTSIQPVIQEHSAKFIAINSVSYVEKSKDQDSGVSKELNCAASVRSEPNFFIPIRLDSVSFEAFPMHYTGRKCIDFSDSWHDGLVELVEELEKAGVAKPSSAPDPAEPWFRSLKDAKKPIEQEETYTTNWLEVKLPSSIYIHRPSVFHHQDLYDIPLPMILRSKRAISFFDDQSAKASGVIESTIELGTDDFLSQEGPIEVDDHLTLHRPRNLVVSLMNKCFERHLVTSGLQRYQRRQFDNLYFYRRNNQNSGRVSLRHLKKTSRAVVGRTKQRIEGEQMDLGWHFAIKAEASLHPAPRFGIFYTLLFTNQNGVPLAKDTQGRLRKSYSNDWHNRRWLETFLAMLVKVSNGDKSTIPVRIDEGRLLYVSNRPVSGVSSVGYEEPAS